MRVIAFCTLAVLTVPVARAQTPLPTTNLPHPAETQKFFVSKHTGSPSPGGDGSEANPWRDLSQAYLNMQAAAPAPALLVVDEGYYGASDPNETFPIRMVSGYFISGRNAHTTIVSSDGQPTEAFEFRRNDGPFHPVDGPYLERLSIRNSAPESFHTLSMTGQGIRLNGDFQNCNFVSPQLEALVLYGWDSAITGEYTRPQILDCTITQNNTGLDNGGVPCCPEWTVLNCIVVDNAVDLRNIHGDYVGYTDFVTATAGEPCQPPPPLPMAGENGNVSVPASGVAFVSPAAGSIWAPTGQAMEFDFRLRSSSGVAGIGGITFAIWDGEGYANPRFGAALQGPVDMGADQINAFSQRPLVRGQVGPSLPATAGIPRTFTVVQNAPVNSTLLIVANPTARLLNPPVPLAGGTLGLLWVSIPYAGIISLGPIIGAPPQTITMTNPAGLRPRMQFIYVDTVGGTVLLTEAQDMPPL